MGKVLTLALLGDLMLGRGVSRKLSDHMPEWFWGDVLTILRQTDGVIANLEAPITTSNERWRRSWKMFHFRADPAAIRILECGNVRFVCLANNHILDFGARGLLDTLRALDAAEIRHAGAGGNAAEAAAPTVLQLPGMKVGFIAATDNMRPFAAGPSRPGTNFIAIADEPAQLAWIGRCVNEVRQAGAGLVVLSLHWGPNMRMTPSKRFRRFARAAIEHGVDVIHGHSAHVVQAIERHECGIILYDTGNFIDDYWKFPFRQTTASFVFLLDIQNGRSVRLRMVPVHTHSSPLCLATGKSFDAIRKRMTSLCATFRTPIIDTAAGLEVPLS